MKIIQINVLSSTRSTGRTTYELHNYLLKNGHQSYIAYGIGQKNFDEHYYKISNFFDYYYHNVLNRICYTQGFHSKIVTKKLIRWMNKIKPDVVHLRNLHSNYINLPILCDYLSKNKIATVITTHDFWFFTGLCNYPHKQCIDLNCSNCKIYGNRCINIFNNKKESILKIDKLFIQANSFFSKSIVDQTYLKDKPCEVVYNWIDFKSFYPEPVSNIFDNKGKSVVIAVWSLLSETQERFKFFIKVAQILKDKYCFVMIGNYSFDTSKYDYIHFIKGTNDINKLRNYYSSADVLFDPSATDTFGKVVAEAMCCGVPCVVFKNQALPELIGDNECGIAIKPFDVNASVDAIKYVVTKGKEYYSSLCINRSKKLFDYETNCEKLIKIYSGLIKNEK